MSNYYQGDFMDIKKGLGKKIQEIRKKQGVTQEILAEFVGIDTVSLSKIETGKNYPTSENLEKICSYLKVDPYELFLFMPQKSEKELLERINKNFAMLIKNRKKLLLLDSVLEALCNSE